MHMDMMWPVDSDVDNFRALSDEFTGITVCGMPMDMQVMQMQV